MPIARTSIGLLQRYLSMQPSQTMSRGAASVQRGFAVLLRHAWHRRPWPLDVLFGGVLFFWGLGILHNPQLMLRHENWLHNAGIPDDRAYAAVCGFSGIVSVVGAVHAVVGFFRIEPARRWAAFAALWVFWAIARMIDTYTGYPVWGGYVAGEMLILAGVM